MRAQGLQTSTMILIILSIVILVFVIIFVILPIIRTSIPAPPPSNVTAFEFNCPTSCQSASSSTPSVTQFCKATLSGTSLHCYDKNPQTGQYFYPNGACTYTDSSGNTIVADSSTC